MKAGRAGAAADAVERARQILGRARSIVVLTGAGISAESGVPTFRGPEGLWKDHRPEELATPEAFARDPRLVWEWYGWRQDVVRRCAPNAAHRALARRALAAGAAPLTLVTQNVDGLHAAAARQVGRELGEEPATALPLELHGSLFRVRCSGCGRRREHDGPVDASSRQSLPRCEGCGELLRPDVVWFGEPLPRRELEESFAAASAADACLVVGTSGVVYPAAGVVTAAAASGAEVVEVNPRETALSATAGVSVRAGAAEAVPRLFG